MKFLFFPERRAWQQRQSRECGAVLIMVLLCMSIVSVIGSLLLREVTTHYHTAASGKATVASAPLLESGMLIATDILQRDMEDKQAGKTSHLFEEWNYLPRILEDFSSELESGELDGSIVDESGLFPLIHLFSSDKVTRKQYEEIFVRLVNGLCRAHGVPQNGIALLQGLQHWKAPLTTPVVDDDWYASQDPPYRRSGKMFTYPGELLLVYWAGLTAEQKKNVLVGNEAVPGLLSLVSVWSKDPINLQTAPREIVLAISPQEAYAVSYYSLVDAYRKNSANRFDVIWYADVAKKTGMDMRSFPLKALGITSKMYRVKLTARIGAGERHLDAVYQLSSGKSECVYRKAY